MNNQPITPFDVRGLRTGWLLVAVLLPLPPATAAAADAPRLISLEEATSLALARNPALAAAGAQVAIAHAGQTAAHGLDDLVLEAAVSAAISRREALPGPFDQRIAADEMAARIDLLKPLSIGGQVGLQLYGEYRRESFSLEPEGAGPRPAPNREEYAPALQLTFRQPLLRGFGSEVARAARPRARAAVDLAVAEQAALATTLLRDVISAYWDVAYATRELQIREQAANSAREQLRRVQANIGVGKQPLSASAEVEVAIASRDEMVLLVGETLAARAGELSRLCGLSPELRSGPMLAARDAPEPASRTIHGPSVLAQAIARNPQLTAIRAQDQAARVDVTVTRNGLLPQLDFFAEAGPAANAPDPHSAYVQMRGLRSYQAMVGLVFQQPLSGNAARGAFAAAREHLRKVNLTEVDITEQLRLSVAQALTNIDTARRRIAVLERSTDAARTDLDAEKARFAVGRSTNFDVLRRQESLAVAQLAHLRARVQLLKSYAGLDALTGELLIRHAAAPRSAGPAVKSTHRDRE